MPRTLYVLTSHPHRRRRHQFTLKDGLVASVALLAPNGETWTWADQVGEDGHPYLQGADIFQFLSWLQLQHQPNTHVVVATHKHAEHSTCRPCLEELHLIHSSFLLSMRMGGRHW